MSLYHVYSQTVADGTATSVVRPSDWNSAHSQVVTVSGNTAGASTASGTNIAYQGSNNVTLSVSQGANAATIVVSGPTTVAQTQQPMYFSASGTNTSANTLQFGNSNGVSFSLSNGSVVATVKTDYQSSNANYLTSQSNQAFSASGGSSAFQTLGFSNQNGVTFTNTNGSVGITHDLQYTSNTSNITANAFPTANSTNLAPASVSSRVVGIVAATNNTGGGTATQSGNVSFSNANGATFYTSAGGAVALSYSVPTVPTAYVSSVNGSSGAISFAAGSSLSSSQNGSTVTWGLASNITTALQSTGNYLTTARASNDAVGLNTAATNVTWTVNSSGISLNAGAYLTTAAQSSASNVSAVYAGTASNGGTATLSGGVSFSNANGVSFYTSAGNAVVATVKTDYLTTARASNDAVGLNTAATNVTWTVNSSGISLNAGAYLTTARASNDAVGLNTAATNVTWTVNSSGISLNAGAYLTTAMASNAGSNFVQANAAFAGTNASGTIASNGISVSVAAGGGLTQGSFYAQGNTTQSSSGTIALSSLNFQGAGIASVGVSNGSVIVSVPSGGGAGDGVNIVQAGTAGTTGTTWSSISATVGINGTNGIIVSQNNSNQLVISNAMYSNVAMTNLNYTTATNGISINNVDDHLYAWELEGVQTAGTTGSTFTTRGALFLSGGPNVTLSGNSNTIVFSAPNPGGGGGVTLSQFPMQPLPMASSAAAGTMNTTTTAGGSATTLSMYVAPFVVDGNVSFNRVFANVSFNTVAGTGSMTQALMWGLYSNNAGTLSQISTWNAGLRQSQNSVTAQTYNWQWGTNSTSNSSQTSGNVSASVQGLRNVLLHTGASSLSPGNYWLVYAQTASTVGLNINLISAMHVSLSQTTWGSMLGTNVSSLPYLMNGIASTLVTSNAAHVGAAGLPLAINSTAITGTGGSSQNRSNVIQFMSQI